MKNIRYGSSFVALTFLAATAMTHAQAPVAGKGDKVQPQLIALTGCVAAGTRSDTFVMTEVHRSDVADAVPNGDIYWLNAPEKLKGHVGHQVEIVGRLDSDTDKASVKTNGETVEVSSERGSKKVEVPVDSPAAAAIQAVGTSGKQTNYKVKVDSVRMISRTCS